jgi:hypothetical protein
MSGGSNILTDDFTISGNNANDVYNSIVTDANLAEGNISTFIENRVNDVLFEGKTKANNSYNSVLTYIAAEAVINAIEHNPIKTSSSTSQTPSKISPSVNNLTATGTSNLSTVDINGGNIDNTIIGSSNPAAGSFTTLNASQDTTLSSNLTVSGNLTVNGTTTTVNSTNTTISDNVLELNSGSSTNANDCGIIIERGSTGDNATLLWDEVNDQFVLGTTTATASSTGVIAVTTGTLNIGTLKIDDTPISSTATEINILDGVTATTSELNILDGVTATTEEINILDGVTATTEEINILDGVTATTEEINILDGVTATTEEIKSLDGDTSATSVTVADTHNVILNNLGNMIQVAMSDIKTYINSDNLTFTPIDRDGTDTNNESSADPTTLTALHNDIYAKLRKIDTFLTEINSNISFSSGYTPLDFNNS